MKRKLISFFISVIIITCFSVSSAQNFDSTYYVRPLSAVKVFPVKVYITPITKGLTDFITLKIERINSAIHYQTTFTRYVNATTDTTIYQLPGEYRVTWLAGGTNIYNPKFVNTKPIIGWQLNGNSQMECTYSLSYADGICGSNEQLDVLFNDSNNIPLKYKWTPSDGLSNDTIRNPVAILNNKITYKVVVITKDSTLSNSVTLEMGVLSVSTGVTKIITCNSSITFNFVTSNYTGSGSLRYKWTPSKGLDNDTLKNPTCTVNENMNYKLTITTPQGCTATSTGMNVLYTKSSAPAIGIVTVNNKKQNVIVWNKTTGTSASKYRIYRETNVTDVYEKIGDYSNDSLSIFVDSTSNAEIQSSKYKLSMIDQCGAETDKSEPHKTIHLSINKGQNSNWNLVWEPYLGFTVQTYNIYRGSTANSLSLLGSTSGSSTQYTDISAPTGNIYYQIEVVAPSTITPSRIVSAQKYMYSKQDSYNSSKSNIASYTITGFNDLTYNEFQLYPNPVKDILYVHSPTPVQFEVYNCSGICVFISPSSNSEQLTVKDWKAGIYFIKTRNNEKVSMLKFIKE